MIDEADKRTFHRIAWKSSCTSMRNHIARSTGFSIPLYRDGGPLWRQGLDAAGEIDVAVIEIERRCPAEDGVLFDAFTPGNFSPPMIGWKWAPGPRDGVSARLPRHAAPYARGVRPPRSPPHLACASGAGYFLTDGRTHRGTSGAPECCSAPKPAARRPTALAAARRALGAARCRTRDLELDEALGLNCAWYADILMTLTEPCLKLNTRSFRDSPRRRASP